jgi:inosine-uridine nucleoside N-ribohydrolase
MEYHDEYQNLEGCVINDPLTLALTFMPELCTYQDLFLDVDLSGGLSMGATIADFYGNTGKPANVKVATGVQPRAFIETFLTQMEKLAASIS